jgi:hypothetical protein
MDGLNSWFVRKPRKVAGFSLVNVLVIFLLALMVAGASFVAHGNAKAKERDATRVNDMILAVKAFAAAKADNAILSGCTGATASAPVKLSSCRVSPASSASIDFATLKDPSGTAECMGQIPAAGSAASSNPSTICDYYIYPGTQANPTVDDFIISFFLESGSGGLAAGERRAGPGIIQ